MRRNGVEDAPAPADRHHEVQQQLAHSRRLVLGCSDELVFSDASSGDRITVLSADYGFRSGSGRLYMDSYGAVPLSIFELSASNFKKELMALRRSIRTNEYKEISDATKDSNESFLRKTSYKMLSALREQLSKLDSYLEDENVLRKLDQPKNVMTDKLSDEQRELLERVKTLQLDDSKVAQTEKAREARDGKVEAPAVGVVLVLLLVALALSYFSLTLCFSCRSPGHPLRVLLVVLGARRALRRTAGAAVLGARDGREDAVLLIYLHAAPIRVARMVARRRRSPQGALRGRMVRLLLLNKRDPIIRWFPHLFSPPHSNADVPRSPRLQE